MQQLPIPLILSNFALSICAPRQPSPSSFWAYNCHSVRKPTYSCQRMATKDFAFTWPTIWTGLSMSRCARNSLFTYSSPSNRISAGKHLRCALRRRRYSGIGGRRASGTCRNPPDWVPTEDGAARSLENTRMMNRGPCENMKNTSMDRFPLTFDTKENKVELCP